MFDIIYMCGSGISQKRIIYSSFGVKKIFFNGNLYMLNKTFNFLEKAVVW